MGCIMEGNEQIYDLKEENRRLRAFRLVTDLTVQRLSVEPLSIEESYSIIEDLKRVAEALFPGKAEVFDLVIAPRLNRVINERFFKVKI